MLSGICNLKLCLGGLMSSFLRHFLKVFSAPLAAVFLAAFASTLMANDGLDENLPVIGKPIPNGINICERASCLGFYPIQSKS